jgi:hypothetical protein
METMLAADGATAPDSKARGTPHRSRYAGKARDTIGAAFTSRGAVSAARRYRHFYADRPRFVRSFSCGRSGDQAAGLFRRCRLRQVN